MMDRIFNSKDEYLEHIANDIVPKLKNGLKISVDFDGTLTMNMEYPTIGSLRESLITELIAWKKKDPFNVLILNTCREGETLKAAVDVCAFHGLVFDFVNQCPYDPNRRKPAADLYIDDKNFPSKNILVD